MTLTFTPRIMCLSKLTIKGETMFISIIAYLIITTIPLILIKII